MTQKRVKVKGKFLYHGDVKLYLKGVTYGTFSPGSNGIQFPSEAIIEQDFRMMAQNGINCVRTYTVPPKFLLDTALAYDIKVMAGLPWEQHITFLDSAERKRNIIESVKNGVLSCENHPAVLCYTIGNEIPATIVRWYGKTKIENFLRLLYKAVKRADPQGLVTYVNYPTTEYLDLSFLDFDCFNVYLETPERLSKYISRLHNLCGDRPLVLAEIGLDSLRNGPEKQAAVLKWQIETVFGKGCAGMFVFAWTDEWWRGGFEIEDWNFGLVDRQRKEKPALSVVKKAMAAVPFSDSTYQPLISVIVCSYNGSATIRDTLEALTRITYPNFEVIVVNDGSRDNTAAIVRRYPVKLIATGNHGLSSARNTGMYHANGEILAYIDDDAYPDEHWLHYLAYAYNTSSHAAIGGPNIIPHEDGPIATCVANAPGGPVHVLQTDEIAEHIPGCNLSVRKHVLMGIGGFDSIYRTAGDDVDVCWRIQQAGHTIGFHHSAVVWHHRRNSLKAYWKQQKGYGKAEALLEAKWPEKYNAIGHLTWAGRIYGNGLTLPIKVKKDRIFHGTWGTALFQSVYQPSTSLWNFLPLMPEWYLVVGLLAFLLMLGFIWTPLFLIWPLFLAAIAIIFIQAAISSYKNVSLSPEKRNKVLYRPLIMLLHIVQPVARLYGRIFHGLTPWRKRGKGIDPRFLLSFGSEKFLYWSEHWRSAEDWLTELERNLLKLKSRVIRGNDFDNWDLQIRNGLFGKTKCLLAIEEHGAGKQYLRLKCWKQFSVLSFLPFITLLIFSGWAAFYKQWIVAAIIGILAFGAIMQVLLDAARSMSSARAAFGLPVNGESFNDNLRTIEKINTKKAPVFVRAGSFRIDQMDPQELSILTPNFLKQERRIKS